MSKKVELARHRGLVNIPRTTPLLSIPVPLDSLLGSTFSLVEISQYLVCLFGITFSLYPIFLLVRGETLVYSDDEE